MASAVRSCIGGVSSNGCGTIGTSLFVVGCKNCDGRDKQATIYRNEHQGGWCLDLESSCQQRRDQH